MRANFFTNSLDTPINRVTLSIQEGDLYRKAVITINQTFTIAMKSRPINAGKKARLEAISPIYADVVRWMYEESKRLDTTSRAILNKECYTVARGMFPIQSTLVQTALDNTLHIRRGYLTAVKKREKENARRIKAGKEPKKPIREPKITILPIMVRQDNWWLVRTTNGYAVKIPTTGASKSLVIIPLDEGEYQRQYLEQVLNGSTKKACLKIALQADGTCKVWMSITIPTAEVLQPQGWLGIDLGICNVAVTSDGKFYGGKAIRYRKNRWSERRNALQKAGRLSRVKKERGAERQWIEDINHKISREIVDHAKATGKGIAMENLRGIKGRTVKAGAKKLNRMNSGWSFNELREFIEYKANLAGIPFMLVDPRGTSRICSNCGCEKDGNRETQAKYVCKDCGFQLHADLNAARNIATRATINAHQVNLGEKGESGTPNGLMVLIGTSIGIQTNAQVPM